MLASTALSLTWIRSAMLRAEASRVRSVTMPAVSRALRYVTQVLATTAPASGISSHSSSCRRRLLRPIAPPQHIAEPAQGDDRDVARLQLLADPVDIDLDRV